MGKTSGFGSERCKAGCTCGRHRANAGSFNFDRSKVEAGAGTRFQRKHPLPSVGDRFSELTVVGLRRERKGACVFDVVDVQCSCGAAPHTVYPYNLHKGRSTRCNACAKKKAGHWRKQFWAYADIVPDDEHRRRLLNRISACFNRCHNPNDAGYPSYGGRGIHVYQPWHGNRRDFLAHIVTLEGWDNPVLELDREDVNRGYEPGNLRFITKRENQGNRRKVRDLQQRIAELEARLRSFECRTPQPVHRDYD